MRQNILMLTLVGSTLAACGGGSDPQNAATPAPKLLGGAVRMGAAAATCDAWTDTNANANAIAGRMPPGWAPTTRTPA
jgi:chitinase